MNNQSSNHLFMIEPEVFYSNKQTADSNHYQKNHDSEFTKDDIHKKALEEFHGLKNKIEENRKVSLPIRKEIRQYCKDNFDWCVIIEKYKEIIESI